MVLAVVWTLTNSSTYCFGKQGRLCNAWMLNKTDMMKVKAQSVWNGPGQACTPVRLAPVRLLFLNCVYNLRWKLLTLKMTEFVNKFHLLQQLHRLPDENQKMPLTMKNFDRQSVLACCCYLWNRRHNAVTWKHKHNKDCSFSHTHLQSCWGILWRYFCIVCPQSGSILHICRRTHMVVYRICWWEPQTPCPRRHTLPWECIVSSSILTLCLHKTSRKSNVTAIQRCSCAHGRRYTNPTQVSSCLIW